LAGGQARRGLNTVCQFAAAHTRAALKAGAGAIVAVTETAIGTLHVALVAKLAH